jgi:hypothetical protein
MLVWNIDSGLQPPVAESLEEDSPYAGDEPATVPTQIPESSDEPEQRDG